ncbi:MAG: 4-hydroxybenzoyl-CoA thioesterase [Bacteroidetes bacterium]|jgi:acyl-CoA thioester hydrolase|nr:4-hydroxybenzoyl-CoA thioesterase [Bacteroidota bacterium]
METLTQKENRIIQHLTNRTEVPVRFSEVDALGIVWHGHYLKFFEDGREAFGKQYKLGYLDIYKENLATPLVNINVDYKKTVKYGDSVIIETTFINSAAAKIIFHYKIFRTSDNELVAKGESTQVFITLEHELFITLPPFFENWKRENNLV